jgi:putative phosphoribosyl transferase
MDFRHQITGSLRARQFSDRAEAGAELATHLLRYRGRRNVVVLGLPRGGVPVAAKVADALDAPLDVFVVRKLGMPGHPEFAIGAIASGGVRVLSEDVLHWYQIPDSAVEAVTRAELVELDRRERAYREGRPPLDLRGAVAILVDDGLATGSTMQAAVQSARARQSAEVVVAVPVASPEACEQLRGTANDVICARTPEPFSAVGLWYRDFSQTTDEEVRDLLGRHAQRTAAGDIR